MPTAAELAAAGAEERGERKSMSALEYAAFPEVDAEGGLAKTGLASALVGLGLPGVPAKPGKRWPCG